MASPEPTSHPSKPLVKWSGLETNGMKDVKCSLLQPPDVKLKPRIKSLPKTSLVVYNDAAWDSSSDSNNDMRFKFDGTTVMQLEPSSNEKGSAQTMPVTMTVAGRCYFTAQDYKNFLLMMRTKQQSEQLEIIPNGKFDWPDVRSFLLCPFCHKSARIPRRHDESNKEFWMLFYPLVQFTVLPGYKMALGTRTICRLTCLECMEHVLKGKTIKVKRTEGDVVKSTVLSATDVLRVVGSVSFLQDKPPRPESHANIHDVMDAHTLYTLWEQCGAWEALQHDYHDMLARSVTGTEPPPQDVDAPFRFGRKCDNPECKRVHGKFDKSLGIIVSLTVPCHECNSVHYCSRKCRTIAFNNHREKCLDYQEKIKLDENKKEARVIKKKKEARIDEKKQNEDETKKQEEEIRKVRCSYCKKRRPYTKMKACSRCKTVAYCSTDCQKEAWNFHKVLCVRRKSQ